MTCVFDVVLAGAAGFGIGGSLSLIWMLSRLERRTRWMQEMLDGLMDEKQRLTSLREEFEDNE